MHRSEAESYTSCADCGAPVDPGRERGYGFAGDGILCWGCAVRRGGIYDAARDAWTVVPRVADLLGNRPEGS